MPKLPETLIAERDALMFEMHKSGMNYRQIARAANVSESTAFNGVKRMKERITKRIASEFSTYAITELERLDQYLFNISHLLKKRKITTPDGGEVEVPPDLDAIKTALQISDRRMKLLGLDRNTIDINISQTGSTPPGLKKEQQTTERTPEQEVVEFLNVARQAGIFDESMMNSIMSVMNGNDVIDAEVVENEGDVGMLAIESPDDEIPDFYEE